MSSSSSSSSSSSMPATTITLPMSKKAQKRAAKKLEKKQKKREAIARLLREREEANENFDDDDGASSNLVVPTGSIVRGGGGGKAARARWARAKKKSAAPTVVDADDDDVGSYREHRANGGAPVLSLIPSDQINVVVALEAHETRMRIRGRPHLAQRKEIPTDNHGSMETRRKSKNSNSNSNSNNKTAIIIKNGSGMFDCSLSECNLRSFSLELIVPSPNQHIIPPFSLNALTSLDLSRNELWDLPGDLSFVLVNLSTLDISRNWFRDLPAGIMGLPRLSRLFASHNMLRHTRRSLRIDDLRALPTPLKCLDISFNQKCGHQKLADLLLRELPSLAESTGNNNNNNNNNVDVDQDSNDCDNNKSRNNQNGLKITVNFPPPAGAFVGASAATRDPTLLRSQLEPWSTTALRRRLVADFGEEVSSPEVPRSQIMERLLLRYAEEEDKNEREQARAQEEGSKENRIDIRGGLCGSRSMVYVDGTRVDASLTDRLLEALRDWSANAAGGNQERTSIRAANYMILTSPRGFALGSRKAAKAAAKLRLHTNLWNLARKTMHSVDPVFARKYTALAVTHGFQGSPHIDKQNVGPFYGLALGDFEEGTGGICVECSARVVAIVNTKNRLGKVDGRYPHWVAPYDVKKERYSLIYYQTTGQIEQVGPAIFQVPVIHESPQETGS